MGETLDADLTSVVALENCLAAGLQGTWSVPGDIPWGHVRVRKNALTTPSAFLNNCIGLGSAISGYTM